MVQGSARRGLFIALVGVVIGLVLGESYIGRLPDHRGFWLVQVEDHLRVLPPLRPRRTVIIVVDGLRRDSAETMASTRRIAARGQCRVSDQGSYTVSRPVYALLSTGLEVDRTGTRNNDLTAPLGIESVWDVARKAGLRVRGASHLPWFKQLFPGGFDEFRHYKTSHEENVFAAAPDDDRFDVDLYHPLYVDENGHHHGGASAEYAAAVARADAEIASLLDRLDLDRDTVILTADHGHSGSGGHGGSQPEIRNVLACFAGPTIQHRDDRLRFDGRVTGPLLSVLLGIPFPASMRAGDDGLDAIWQIVHYDDAYTKDRQAAIDHFRRENEAAVTRWLGGAPGTWDRLYAHERSKQHGRALLVFFVALGVFALRVLRAPRRWQHATWVLATMAFTYAAHHAVLGDLDYTVVNLKERFVPAAFFIVGIASAAALALHYALHRTLASSARGYATLVLLLLVVNLGHILVYGWPLGFPLPIDAARYWPFFGAIAQVGFAIVTASLLFFDRAGSGTRPIVHSN